MKTLTVEVSELLIAFIVDIGIDVCKDTISDDTFLPGIRIQNGGLLVDMDKLLYPGDLLHEAGHLAVMPLRIRKDMNGDLGNDNIQQGGEMAAIAWSYAACMHLSIDPRIVFHEHGYKGYSEKLIGQFENGNGLGVPLLIWQDMAAGPDAEDDERFPKMKSWLCQVDKYLD